MLNEYCHILPPSGANSLSPSQQQTSCCLGLVAYLLILFASYFHKEEFLGRVSNISIALRLQLHVLQCFDTQLDGHSAMIDLKKVHTG